MPQTSPLNQGLLGIQAINPYFGDQMNAAGLDQLLVVEMILTTSLLLMMNDVLCWGNSGKSSTLV